MNGPGLGSRAQSIIGPALILCLTSCSHSSLLAPNGLNIAASYAEPAWHPGGNTLVFDHTPLARRYKGPDGRLVYEFAESLSGFWAVRSDGSNLRRLYGQAYWTPDWNSAGTVLTFEVGASIWTVAGADTGIDIGTAVQLTGSERAFAPTWSPDGSAIAYSVHTLPGAGIYVIPSSGGISRQVGDPGWRHPDWSPSGDSLVFVATLAGKVGICIADTAGLGVHMIWGYPQASARYPRWSSAGTIAFTGRTNDSEPTRLWVMKADGSNAHAVLGESVQDFFSWGPDGKEIAYVPYGASDTSLTSGTVWIVDTVSGAKRQVTYNTPTN